MTRNLSAAARKITVVLSLEAEIIQSAAMTVYEGANMALMLLKAAR